MSKATAMRALNRFEKAVRDDEMKGSMHPSDYALVEREYAHAKKTIVEIP